MSIESPNDLGNAGEALEAWFTSQGIDDIAAIAVMGRTCATLLGRRKSLEDIQATLKSFYTTLCFTSGLAFAKEQLK